MRISAAKKKETVELELEDGQLWTLELREMSAKESDEYGAFLSTRINQPNDDGRGTKADLIQRCLFDPATGKRVEMLKILEMPSTVQNILHMQCNELNGYTIDSLEKAKKKADAEKKS